MKTVKYLYTYHIKILLKKIFVLLEIDPDFIVRLKNRFSWVYTYLNYKKIKKYFKKKNICQNFNVNIFDYFFYYFLNYKKNK